MAEILRMRHDEAVRMDMDRLERLFDDLGAAEAEAVTARALSEIGRRLDQMSQARARGDDTAFAGLARSLARVAAHVGLPGLARVARDAGACALSGNPVALAATWARLERQGHRALASVWDAQDMSI